MTRILFLHGYTQSGNTLRHKTGALSRTIQKYAEITYPTGPVELYMPDDPDPEERERLAKLGNEQDEGSYAWWEADHDEKVFKGFDMTMTFLKGILEKEGPFDGVMGFSQGGCLAAMLASALERPNKFLQSAHPPFKFAIIFSGFRSTFPLYEALYSPMIKTPTLHVIGNRDTLITPERSTVLADCCLDSKIITHPSSHVVPSSGIYRSQVLDFILTHIKKPREMTAIVAATDTGLGIGKDGGLPWRLKKEMKYFAEVTSLAPEGKQNVVIMGRNSWTSIPEKFRPLKGRINIVVTSNTEFELVGVAMKSKKNCLATSLDDALIQVEKQFSDIVHKVFVIGGSQLYKTAMVHPGLRRILFTSIKSDIACDTNYPVDFRSRRRSEEVSWKRRPFEELKTWAGVDVNERETENEISWEYEMWEKDDGGSKL